MGFKFLELVNYYTDLGFDEDLACQLAVAWLPTAYTPETYSTPAIIAANKD